MDNERWISAQTFADLVGCSRQAVLRAIRQGRLAHKVETVGSKGYTVTLVPASAADTFTLTTPGTERRRVAFLKSQGRA